MQHALFHKRLELELPLRLPYPQPLGAAAAVDEDLADFLADYQHCYHPLETWYYTDNLAETAPDERLGYLLPECYGLWDWEYDLVDIALDLDEPLRFLSLLVLGEIADAADLSAELLAEHYPELAIQLPADWQPSRLIPALRHRPPSPPLDGLGDVLAYLTRSSGSDLLDLSLTDSLQFSELPPFNLAAAQALRAEYRRIQPTLAALRDLAAWYAAAPDPARLRRLFDLLCQRCPSGVP